MKVTSLTAILTLTSAIFVSNSFAAESSSSVFVKEVLGGQRTPAVASVQNEKPNVDKSLSIFMEVLTNKHARVTPEVHTANLSANANSYTNQFTH